MTKEQKRIKEIQEVHEIYEGLNLRQMEHLLYLMKDRIVIPHAFNDGVCRDMEIDYVAINGAMIGIVTDFFANHLDNTDGKN